MEDEGPSTPVCSAQLQPLIIDLGFYLDKLTEYIHKVLQHTFPERVDLRCSLENWLLLRQLVNIESSSLTLFLHFVSQSALIDW